MEKQFKRIKKMKTREKIDNYKRFKNVEKTRENSTE